MRTRAVVAVSIAIVLGVAGIAGAQDASPSPASTPTATAAPTPAASAAPTASPEGKTPKAPTEQRVNYAEAIVIDWSKPQVEIAAEVVLREGPLELLLCKRKTKEHESIFATDAQALKVYEALGLVGVMPGNPPLYDPQTKKTTAAKGQPVSVRIEWEADGKKKSVAPQVLLQRKDDKPVDELPFIFTGSRTAGETFTAEADGTLICLVDFDTMLVGLADSHTSANEQLWLKANTAAIPPKGTKCTIVLKATHEDVIRVALTPELYFIYHGEVIDANQLDRIIKDGLMVNPELKLELSVAPGTNPDHGRLTAPFIVGSGIKKENLILNLPEPTPTPAATPAPTAKPSPEAAASPAPAEEGAAPKKVDSSPRPAEPKASSTPVPAAAPSETPKASPTASTKA